MTSKITYSSVQSIESPPITALQVQQALERLIFTTRTSSSLCDLCMVEYMLDRPLSFISAQAKEQALSTILVSFITYELLEQRAKFHLPPPVSEATMEQVKAAIVADTQTRNAELIGVSYLYYRYVWRDACVSYEWFASVAGFDENTIDSCYDNALGWLTQKLVDEESAARDRRCQDMIAASLPPLLHTDFVGRYDDFVRTMRWLAAPVTHHVQVVGQSGIGKSAFVYEIAKRLAEMDCIDDFVWIQNPYSVGEIQRGLRGIQKNEPTSKDILKPKLPHRMLYVFDNFICPGDELTDFDVLLDHLSSSIVFVTTRSYIPTARVMEHITLSELDKGDAMSLIRALVKFYRVPSGRLRREDAIENIWNCTGGHPNAIETFIAQQGRKL
jgi:hypothetical protein